MGLCPHDSGVAVILSHVPRRQNVPARNAFACKAGESQSPLRGAGYEPECFAEGEEDFFFHGTASCGTPLSQRGAGRIFLRHVVGVFKGRKGFVRFLTFTILSSFLFVLPGFGADKATESEIKKDQIEKIEKELSKEREKFLEYGKKEKSLLRELSRLEVQIEEKKRTVKEIREKIAVNKKELQGRQKKLEELERISGRISQRIGTRLDVFYRYARRGYMRLLASSRDLDQIRKRFKYLKIIMEEDQRLMEELGRVQQAQRREIGLVKEKLAIIERMEQEERRRTTSLKEDMDKRVMLLLKIHKEKEFYETVVEELELAARDLKERLLKLERRREQRKELPSDFQKFKSKLPLPMKGRIVKGEGPFASVHMDGDKGIFIEGAPAAPVMAIFAGRVDFSGWLKGYGQVIIINHGSRYFSVSAHLAQRNKEEGEMVGEGELIGYLGQPESATNPRLYFEIRKGGLNLDPLKWVKVR
jgi:septal ring factor EnvC (AmiA/AmiB activator)